MFHHVQQLLNDAIMWFWNWIAEGHNQEYERHRRGRIAEEAVTSRLRECGYRILERNFTCKSGEIDIIAFHDGKVIFVEVRSVTDPARVAPLASITPQKQQRIIRAAQRYATIHNLREENVFLRFDAVGVHRDQKGQITRMKHVVDAFRA